MKKLCLMKDLANPACHVNKILERNQTRKYQVHPINQGRKKYGQYQHLFGLLRQYEIKFKQYTRMEISTFDYILSKIQKDLTEKWCNLHRKGAILPEEQLVVTLRYLATGMTFGDLATTFLMGKSTVSGIIRKTLKALWENLYPIHMKVPTEKDWLQISQEFYELRKFPHCLGALDARHVRIKKPNRSGSYYFNHKRFNSTTLQALVGAKSRYITIDVGGYGGQHDSTTFKVSTLHKALQKKILKLPKDDKLPDSDTVMPYFFIGDCAYPLMQHMLKPYPGKRVTEEQDTYNYHLSGTRMVVERAFGQDCQRWRIYYTKIECQPKVVEMIVMGTCVLRNVIIDMEKEKIMDMEKQEVSDKSNKKKKRKNNVLAKIIDEFEDDDDDSDDGFPIGRAQENREKMKNYIVKYLPKRKK